jgi:hypothetical protein
MLAPLFIESQTFLMRHDRSRPAEQHRQAGERA